MSGSQYAPACETFWSTSLSRTSSGGGCLEASRSSPQIPTPGFLADRPGLVQEARYLADQALGPDPQLEDRRCLNEATIRKLLDEVRRVAKRVDEVEVMPDHERGRLDRPALLDRRSDRPDEESVQHGGGLLGLEHQG